MTTESTIAVGGAELERLAGTLLDFRNTLTPGELTAFDALLRAAANQQAGGDVEPHGIGPVGGRIDTLARVIGVSAVALSLALSLGVGSASAAPVVDGGTASPAAQIAITQSDLRIDDFDTPHQLRERQTETVRFTIRSYGTKSEDFKVVISSHDLPARFEHIRVVDQPDSYKAGFHCQVVDATGPSAKAVCGGDYLLRGDSVTFELRLRTGEFKRHGDGEIRVHVDPGNRVAEFDEHNNIRTNTVHY